MIETPTAVVPVELLVRLKDLLPSIEFYGDVYAADEADALYKEFENLLNNYQWGKDA